MSANSKAVREADSILRDISGYERAHGHVCSVVQESVVAELNVNTVKAHVRGRPFCIRLSGRTKRGHRGFTFIDSLLLRLGRKTMTHGLSSQRTQFFVDSFQNLIEPCVQTGASAWIYLSNELLFVLTGNESEQELSRQMGMIKANVGPAVTFELRIEIVDLTERIAAMLENRPYREPESVRLERERQRENMVRALLSCPRIPAKAE
jgi:hypothetical protein